MRRQLHSASAAAAITSVLCAASFTFVVYVLLPVPGFQAAHVFQVRSVNVQVLNIARATGLVLLLGYGAGVVGWILALALRRDGMHRLGSMHSVSRR